MSTNLRRSTRLTSLGVPTPSGALYRSRAVRSLSLHSLIWALPLVALIAGANLELLPLPSRFSADSVLVRELAADFLWRSDDTNESWSYLRIASFFFHLSFVSPQQFALLVGLLYVYVSFRFVRDPFFAPVLALALLPSALLCLPYAQKDTISSLAAIVIVVASRHVPPQSFLFAIVVALIYAAVAFFVRPYYVIMAACFLWLRLFFLRSPLARVLALGLPVFVTLLLATGLLGDYHIQLQKHRDFYNLHRIFSDAEGHRTAFTNLVSPDNMLHFFVNYVYAAVILSFPFLKFGTWFDAGATIYSIILMGFLIVMLVRNRDAHPFANLIWSHMMTLWIFDPDVGSYQRHLSTIMIYLAPLLHYLELPPAIKSLLVSPRLVSRSKAKPGNGV